jgi:hypothetical protein
MEPEMNQGIDVSKDSLKSLYEKLESGPDGLESAEAKNGWRRSARI